MNAVCDGAHRVIMSVQDRCKHGTRHLAMRLADGIDRTGTAYRQNRHIEPTGLIIVVSGQPQHGFAALAIQVVEINQLVFDPINGKRIVCRGHRRVRDKYRG